MRGVVGTVTCLVVAMMAGGAGLRVLFNKRSKTNICMDFAWGRGSRGLYFALQEAFQGTVVGRQ